MRDEHMLRNVTLSPVFLDGSVFLLSKIWIESGLRYLYINYNYVILNSRDNFLKTCFGMTHAIMMMMMAWVMPKHVFKKLSREFKIFVNSIIVTKLWKC